MWAFLVAVAGFAATYGLVLALVRLLHPEWWRLGAVRRARRWLPFVVLAAILAWRVPVAIGAKWAALPGATLVVFVVMSLLALVGALPVSGLAGLAVRIGAAIADRRRAAKAPGPRGLRRRDVLLHATAAIPGAALAAVGLGVAGAFEAPGLARLSVGVPGLPPALEGLRILQLTDIHLGTFVSLRRFAEALERCAAARPDLVVVTGDACDDLPNLHAMLGRIRDLDAPLGCYASLGNHEYFRGAATFRRAYERAGIPLLVSEGVRVPVGDASLWIGGADDPAVMGRQIARFLEASIDRAVRDRQDGEPALLLSHRPDGFVASARRGVSLTLAGHTHGGQIGGGSGRSAFEALLPHWYLRGAYRRGPSTLYTSAGFGHWLPFRLACAPEIPLVRLTRADRARAAALPEAATTARERGRSAGA